jgi:hypothetical protein
MKCPFCDIEMLRGYLNCGIALWSERKHKIGLLPDGKEKYALRLRTPLVPPHQIKSYCCPKCKKIIIDAEDYENNLD